MTEREVISMGPKELPQVRLECFDEASAQWILDYVDENVPAERRGPNAVRRDGSTVIITYSNYRWPYDIAEMAEAEGLAGDKQIGSVFACL